jgi:hypothetical protein
VFSGAGISGEAPASLPRGFGLRDDLLRLMHAEAGLSLGGRVSDGQLADLLTIGRGGAAVRSCPGAPSRRRGKRGGGELGDGAS